MRRLTQDEFINKCISIHGDTYSYDNAIYKGAHKKVTITCKTHGDFLQTPNGHTNDGYGCQKCSSIEMGKHRRSSSTYFQNRANLRHNFQYDYSKVIYITAHKKVEIICKEHGSFWQTPDSHISNHGCPKCGGLKIASARSIKQEEVISRLVKVHEGRYNYKNVEYNGYYKEIEIICKEHGSFWQKPDIHLRGAGCPKCAQYGFDNKAPAILYYILDLITNLYKIGITNKKVLERFPSKKYKERIKIIYTEYYNLGKDAQEKEKELHLKYKNYRVFNSKWASDNTNGSTEFFNRDVLQKDGILLSGGSTCVW